MPELGATRFSLRCAFVSVVGFLLIGTASAFAGADRAMHRAQKQQRDEMAKHVRADRERRVAAARADQAASASNAIAPGSVGPSTPNMSADDKRRMREQLREATKLRHQAPEQITP
jgi:hypothetical protein